MSTTNTTTAATTAAAHKKTWSSAVQKRLDIAVHDGGKYYIAQGSDSEPEPEEYFAEYFESLCDNNNSDATAGNDDDKNNEPRCVSCGIALGRSNPRQYCCKTYCPTMADEK